MKKRAKKTSKEEDSPKIKELKHKSRRHSIKEGIFSVLKTSFGDHFISPFAIAINMSSPLVATLSSISGLLGPFSQLLSARLTEKYSRKKIMLKSLLLESLMWIPLIAIAILFYLNIITHILPTILLFSFSFYVIFSNIGSPAWFSWMGDIVDEEYRGRWFAKRSLILGFVTMVFAISGSFVLDFFKDKNIAMAGFGIFFLIAMTSRLIARKIVVNQYEPKIKTKKEDYFPFWDFVLNAPKNNFGEFAIFRALLAFSTSLAAPMIAIYLLRHLNFSYSTYMIIIFSGTFFSLLVLELWGKFADTYGNYKTMAITTILIPIIPIAWSLFESPLYLILVPSLIGGISWAGFNLAASNFIYDNISPTKRGLAVSYYNMLNGIGVFAGAGVGALLIKYLQTEFINPILLIFFISAIARMIVIFIFIPRIKERRKTKRLSGTRALKHIILKEMKPTLLEEAHQLRSINKYFTTK